MVAIVLAQTLESCGYYRDVASYWDQSLASYVLTYSKPEWAKCMLRKSARSEDDSTAGGMN